jgi:hypothetical protein
MLVSAICVVASEAQGELVVAHGDAPVLLLQVDAGFDGVPLAVDPGRRTVGASAT